MAECAEIPVEYTCLNKGESTLDTLGTFNFDITGAKLEAQYRHELTSGLSFSYTS